MPNAFPSVHVTGVVHHWIRTRESVDPWYLGTAETTPQMQLTQHYQESQFGRAGSTLPFQRKYDGQSALVSVLLSRYSKEAEQYTRFLRTLLYGAPVDTVASGATLSDTPEDSAGKTGLDGQAKGLGGAKVAVGKAKFFPNLDFDSGTGKGPGAEPLPESPSKPPPFDVVIPPKDQRLYSGGAGQESRWSRGSWVYGSRDFELWQVFEFAIRRQSTSQNLELGWYWPRVCLQDRQQIAAGTQAEKLLLVFDCQPRYLEAEKPLKIQRLTVGSATLVTGIQQATIKKAERGWVLYSTDASAFPKALGVPQ